MKTQITLAEIENVLLGSVEWRDAPDYADAYVVSANWKETGEPLTDAELDSIESDVIYELASNR
jgi:hypothetical protein